MSSRFDNIHDMVVGYCEIKMQIDRLTEKKKELEEQIKPILADQGDQDFEEFRVKAVSSPGRKTLDRKLMEASFGDLSGFEKIGKPSIRMTVKKL